MSQIASDLRFAIRITNRNCSHIARFGALSGRLRPWQWTELCNSGRRLHRISLNFLIWIFTYSSGRWRKLPDFGAEKKT